MTQINNAYVLGRMGSNTQQKSQKQHTDVVLNKSFDEVMENAKETGVSLSKHAKSRLQTRGINLSPLELKKVSTALDSAANKGVNEAVIVMGEKLFIASVKNRTIITAANQQDIEEKIITKIDGAIFV